MIKFLAEEIGGFKETDMKTRPGESSSRSQPSFTETEVSFESAGDGVTLAGTFTCPVEPPVVPAAVLVAGGGPLDRDVTLIGHKLYRVSALHLARAGIATLRFDKRGVGESGGDFDSATADDFVADVLAAAKFLRGDSRIDARRVGLVGHSEGGMISLSAAAQDPQVEFCVLLAGPLLSGKENFVHSFALLARGSLQRDAEYTKNVAGMRTVLEFARSTEAAEVPPHVLEFADQLASRIFNESTKSILGAQSLTGTELIGLLRSSCLDTCLNWEPEPVLRQFDGPALLLYAEKDVQAPAFENLTQARRLRDHLNKTHWEIREIPGMNHPFQRCATGMPDEYESIDHVMAEEVLDEVAVWIQTHSYRPARRHRTPTYL